MLNVLIVGRKWFEKTNGNTYHTAEIYINGKFVHKTGITYGYERHYVQTGLRWLENNNHIPAHQPETEPDYKYFKRIGLNLEDTITRVSRKKDL